MVFGQGQNEDANRWVCSRGFGCGLDHVPKLARRQELCDRALVSISHCRSAQPLPQNLRFFIFFLPFICF